LFFLMSAFFFLFVFCFVFFILKFCDNSVFGNYASKIHYLKIAISIIF
jgi:hypothetical protein